MIDAASVQWKGISTVLDEVERPSLSIARADHPQDSIKLVMSDWMDAQSLRQFSILFEQPAVVIATEEMLFSIAGPGSSRPGRAPNWLCEATASPLLDQYQAAEPFAGWILRHFALIGGNTCWEVLCKEVPAITAQPSFEAAMSEGSTNV
jgi:hypothetical protein